MYLYYFLTLYSQLIPILVKIKKVLEVCHAILLSIFTTLSPVKNCLKSRTPPHKVCHTFKLKN